MRRKPALDAVRARFVERVFCLHIGADLFVCHLVHIHGRPHRIIINTLFSIFVIVKDRNSGINVVPAPLQAGQHPHRIFLIRRFPQDLPVQYNDRIRTDDNCIPYNARSILFRKLLRHIFRFHQRQLFYDLFRHGAVINLFFITYPDFKIRPDLRQQFPPTG